MSDREFLPAPPDPAAVTKWMGQVRAWLGVLMMFGIAVPNIPDAKLQAYVSAALLAVGVGASIWSWIEKRRQERATKDLVVDSAVASARSGVPVVVAVTETTPPGQPNVGVATQIPATDVATATLPVATVAPSPPGTTARVLNEAELRRVSP